MPQIIPILILAAADVITYTVAAELIGLTLLSTLLAPKAPRSPTQLSDGTTQEFTGTIEPRRIIYGQTLVSGMNCIPPWCHGTKNEMLDQVLALAGHECDAITDIYANQELIASANITAITGAQTDGKVTSGTYANKLWVRRYPGVAAGVNDFILHAAWPSYWDTNHLGKGVANLCIQYQYDTTVYSGGKPEIRALVRGKKVYDPRLDSTNGGSGSQRIATPSTWTYSNNPALAISDYLMDANLGLGEDSTRIDWVSVTAAANICDETVSIPSTTQKRYTIATVLDCTADYEENIKQLAGAMQGAVLYTAGKWILLPGKYASPTFTVGDDDVVGSLAFRTKFPYKDRYNAVRGQFYNPATLWQPDEYPPIRVGADETTDGEGPVWLELQQPTCTDQYESQRNAIIKQRKSRRPKTWNFQAAYSLYGVRPGEFGTLNLTEPGISGQIVRCTGWKLNPQTLQVEMALEEAASADWNDPATGVYQSMTALSGPAPMNFISDGCSSLTATAEAGGITFVWTLPTTWYYNLVVELLEAPTNNIAGASVIWTGSNTGVFIKKSDTTVRYYWVRVRNQSGNTVSPTFPAGATSGQAGNANLVQTGDINPSAATDVVASNPADSNLHYGTIVVGSPGTDTRVVATVSVTNSTSAAVPIEVAYKGLFNLAGAEPSGCTHRAFLAVSNGVSYSESTANWGFTNTVSPSWLQKSGSVALSLPAGATAQCDLKVILSYPSGTSVVPDANYSDVSIQVQSIKR